jgi:RimJ/RimL family protein N-acetyltransferase
MLTSKPYAKKMILSVLACLPISTGIATEPHTVAETKPIGLLILREVEPDQPIHRNTAIGIQIDSKYQGQGYGSEAIGWILRWGFKTAGLHRIEITVDSFNNGALGLYERLGFVLEGKDRGAVWYDGGWHDLIRLGMLDSEWRELVEQKK